MRKWYLISCLLLVLAGCGLSHEFTATVVEPPKPLQDFTLNDQHGQPFKLSDQRGKLVLLYFGYTHCPDFCPATLADWKRVKQQLGTEAEKVRFVMISVDPQRDTEQALNEYLAPFDPSFVGLRPTLQQLEALSREYGVGVDMRSAAAAHTNDSSTIAMMHGTYFYVLDQAGKMKLLFRPEVLPDQITADIRALL